MACCLRPQAITWTNAELSSNEFCGLGSDFIGIAQIVNSKNEFENYTFEIIFTSQWGQWVK